LYATHSSLNQTFAKRNFKKVLDENKFQRIYINGAAIAWYHQLKIDTKAICRVINKANALQK
jgi:hypothetical protein